LFEVAWPASGQAIQRTESAGEPVRSANKFHEAQPSSAKAQELRLIVENYAKRLMILAS
jgi:hypothetical protein